MSFKAHEKATRRRAFCSAFSISNLNHPNTADMKRRGGGRTVTHCGFIPLMSSAARTLLQHFNVCFSRVLTSIKALAGFVFTRGLINKP